MDVSVDLEEKSEFSLPAEENSSSTAKQLLMNTERPQTEERMWLCTVTESTKMMF